VCRFTIALFVRIAALLERAADETSSEAYLLPSKSSWHKNRAVFQHSMMTVTDLVLLGSRVTRRIFLIIAHVSCISHDMSWS
jgi:hypothetical protein